MSDQTYKPGEDADKDLKLYVTDSNGNNLGEINVPSGSRVPPTRFPDAEQYVEK